jgi:hypothetical protein
MLPLRRRSYDEGQVSHAGVGHSGGVTALAVAPEGGAIVSVGTEGGIFAWEYPSAEERTSVDMSLNQ